MIQTNAGIVAATAAGTHAWKIAARGLAVKKVALTSAVG
jgi:hypothetical protein